MDDANFLCFRCSLSRRISLAASPAEHTTIGQLDHMPSLTGKIAAPNRIIFVSSNWIGNLIPPSRFIIRMCARENSVLQKQRNTESRRQLTIHPPGLFTLNT
jgi:hypothetical protein